MAVFVSEEQQQQRKMLKAAVAALKQEYQQRSAKIGGPRLRPVVPKLYTRGAAGREELFGHPRYWDREQGAGDEQHGLWGWRILNALQKVANREREELGLGKVSLVWTVKNVLEVLERAAPAEDADAFATMNIDVYGRPYDAFGGRPKRHLLCSQRDEATSDPSLPDDRLRAISHATSDLEQALIKRDFAAAHHALDNGASPTATYHLRTRQHTLGTANEMHCSMLCLALGATDRVGLGDDRDARRVEHERGLQEVVERLLALGADPNAYGNEVQEDGSGGYFDPKQTFSPLRLARNRGVPEVVAMLEGAGAEISDHEATSKSRMEKRLAQQRSKAPTSPTPTRPVLKATSADVVAAYHSASVKSGQPQPGDGWPPGYQGASKEGAGNAQPTPSRSQASLPRSVFSALALAVRPCLRHCRHV